MSKRQKIIYAIPNIKQLLLIVFCLLTVSCGENNKTQNNKTPPTNAAPKVNAGSDQVVNENLSVDLFGSAEDEDGTIISYNWLQTSGTTVTLSNKNTNYATFTAPEVSSDESLSFSLTVTDDAGGIATSSVNILVTNINKPPSVDAGPEQFVDEASQLTILGLASDPDGDIFSYQWSQISGPLAQLKNSDQKVLELIIPPINEDTKIVLELSVMDNEGLSVTDHVLINVNNVEILLVGKFIDSTIEGAVYLTASRAGATNSNGEFHYMEGETITFSIGDLELPSVMAKQILTPLELASTNDINDVSVVNIARLLQSLDQDCDPTNGIKISSEAHLSAEGMKINFDDQYFDSKVHNLVENAGQTDPLCRVLIEAEQAVSHLQETLNNLEGPIESPIGNGLHGKIGFWEGVGQQDISSWSIKINLELDQQLIEYPSLSCGGYLTLLEESKTRLLFKETITFGTRCYDQGLIELTDISSTELMFRYFLPSTNVGMGELGSIGTLARKK